LALQAAIGQIARRNDYGSAVRWRNTFILGNGETSLTVVIAEIYASAWLLEIEAIAMSTGTPRRLSPNIEQE